MPTEPPLNEQIETLRHIIANRETLLRAGQPDGHYDREVVVLRSILATLEARRIGRGPEGAELLAEIERDAATRRAIACIRALISHTDTAPPTTGEG